MPGTIRKGINIWSFDQSLSIETCMEMAKDAGFEGIELALAAKGPLSMESTDADALRIRDAADRAGIAINALATGLYWQYSLTSNREDIRRKAMAVARREMEIGKLLGADTVMVCPGAVGVDFQPEDVVPDAHDIEFFAGAWRARTPMRSESVMRLTARASPSTRWQRACIGSILSPATARTSAARPWRWRGAKWKSASCLGRIP